MAAEALAILPRHDAGAYVAAGALLAVLLFTQDHHSLDDSRSMPLFAPSGPSTEFFGQATRSSQATVVSQLRSSRLIYICAEPCRALRLAARQLSLVSTVLDLATYLCSKSLSLSLRRAHSTSYPGLCLDPLWSKSPISTSWLFAWASCIAPAGSHRLIDNGRLPSAKRGLYFSHCSGGLRYVIRSPHRDATKAALQRMFHSVLLTPT
ncbi:hypothetical protein NUW54_g3404 [Trametes sanguinea]|uniref:Uncharacterized protein n=1 Tax=Trametes sanguinea TaxID=158606 RepID=A0ACC1Q0U6_9APHY|nr:hypothetical protein NUW54_g3404 [Trametes sanguinea]